MGEVEKLRKDIEEANIQNESVLMNLKRKHQDAVSEMSEQIEQLTKMKAKIEKDKSNINHEISDVRAATDEINRSKASAEKSNKVLVNTLNDQNKKVEEATLTLGDFEASKRKMAAENSDLLRSVQELENNANMLNKFKTQLVNQLDEAKRVADFEAKERLSLLGKYKNIEHELEGTKSLFDEECGDKDNVMRKVAKANEEADMWKKKYEIDAVAKAEDLEMAKLKLQSRLSEAETTTEQLNARLGIIERAKAKLQAEIDEVATQLDQAHILNSSMEKKAKQFDKVIGEWKAKADSYAMDLDVAQKEARKENKVLSNEIKDIMDQISEGGRSIHEIDKIRKRLEAEKMELQAVLEEAEGALEQEENKVLRAQLELSQVRTEIERRISEKEEEFMGVKKN